MTDERICGACDACCTHLAIKKFESPAGEPCPHQMTFPEVRGERVPEEPGLGCCSIYEDRPQNPCKGFYCLYLGLPGNGPEQNLDRLIAAHDFDGRQPTSLDDAVVVHYRLRMGAQFIQIGLDESHRPDQLGVMFSSEQVGVGAMVVARELREGAAGEGDGARLIESISRLRAVVVRRFDGRQFFRCGNARELVAIFLIMHQAFEKKTLKRQGFNEVLYNDLESQCRKLYHKLVIVTDLPEELVAVLNFLQPIFGGKNREESA